MENDSGVDSLFGQETIQQLAKEITEEFANRNLFPLTHFHLFIKDQPERSSN